MNYFGKRLKSSQIVVSEESLSSNDPEILKRLERIERNYSKLSEILTELEVKFELEEELDRSSSDRIDSLPNQRRPNKPR